MNRCPCCNARLRETRSCPRCRTDLTAIIEAGESAAFWLNRAIHYWRQQQLSQSIDALLLSIQLQHSQLASAFREFIIQQISRSILKQLRQNQILEAKRQLHQARKLLTYSNLLLQLQGFTDYLLISKPLPDSPHNPEHRLPAQTTTLPPPNPSAGSGIQFD